MKPTKIIFILLILTLSLFRLSGTDSVAEETSKTEQIDQDKGQEEWLGLWTRVQKIRLDRMKEVLQLDNETMNRLTPHLNQLSKKKREIGRERLFLMKSLKKLTKTKASEEQLKESLGRLKENNAVLDALQQEQNALLKAHLTLDQQARYILFQREFNKELRDTIRKERAN